MLLPDPATTIPSSSFAAPKWEIEKRWRDSSIFHPMITLGIGTVKAEYLYTHRRADGTWDHVIETPGAASVYPLALGLEASVFKYVSIYTLMGVRRAGNLSLIGVEPGGFSGGYTTIGMGFGKFR
jgi:hypothetical protein